MFKREKVYQKLYFQSITFRTISKCPFYNFCEEIKIPNAGFFFFFKQILVFIFWLLRALSTCTISFAEANWECK